MNVGFIGTGTMGQPMVANLIKKGFAVLAYDTSPPALRGPSWGRLSTAEAVRRSDLVVTMLPSSSACRGGIPGPRRAGVGGERPAVRTCRRSIPPCRAGSRPRSPGGRCADAPVSGGVPGAVDGTLAIMVGGDARDPRRPGRSCGHGRQPHPRRRRGAGGGQDLQQPHRRGGGGGGQRGVPHRGGVRRRSQGADRRHLEVVRQHVGHAAGAPGARPGGASGLQPRLRPRLHDRSGWPRTGLAVNAARELRCRPWWPPPPSRSCVWPRRNGLGRKDFTAVYTFLKPPSDQAPV